MAPANSSASSRMVSRSPLASAASTAAMTSAVVSEKSTSGCAELSRAATAWRSKICWASVRVEPPPKESAARSVTSARSPSNAASKTLPSVWVGKNPVAAHASGWFFQKPGVQPSSPGGVVVVEHDVVVDDDVDKRAMLLLDGKIAEGDTVTVDAVDGALVLR